MIAEATQHYQILKKLGVGTVGEVYLAEDIKQGRKVVLRVFSASAVDPAQKSQVLRDLHAASELNHPNVALIYEVGETNENAFVAMEFIEGQTLEAAIRKGSPGLPQAVDFGLQLAGAIGEAHRRGLTHYGIRPASIMILPCGQLKVLDLGLGRIACAAAEGITSMQYLQYMSPEQVMGEGTDHRTDLFSMGVVLYEMVTGQRPFCGRSPEDLVRQIIHAQPDWSSHLNRKVDIPTELLRAIGRCLQKDPARRYQTAGDLADDLRNVSSMLEFF